MTLVRWNPFREMENVIDRYNRIYHPQYGKDEGFTVADWAPVVDITETEQEYQIKAELPEVKKDDVKIEVDKGVLTLKGERKTETETKDKKVHKVERFYGSFARSFTLPENTDQDQITAESKDGMLYIHIPKIAEPKPKAIEVAIQ